MCEERRGWGSRHPYSLWGLECMLPVVVDLILRVKDTIPQKELNDLERKNNLKNAFQIRKNIVEYKKVLVVDDIYTTGATVEAVAEELK